jgi:hypothetical protein
MSNGKSEATKENSWWQTLPGILTGVAALLTALGGLIAVLYQNDLLNSSKLPTSVPNSIESGAEKDGSEPANEQTTTTDTNSNGYPSVAVQAGHYSFKLLDTKIDPYPGSSSPKVLLRLQIRVTDLVGVADYVDSQTIRLLVEGAELFPENFINVAVYDKQSQEIEAVFTIPADVDQVNLLVGRSGDGVAQIPIPIKL